ncbi:tyrosine--tRNA ligase [Rickettsiales bacterium (ex Bugula neritina AB1)]|nr:tyrosine--tRNA ligase [Rickettsiales bacterium (ex Bugula neritina AB1)]
MNIEKIIDDFINKNIINDIINKNILIQLLKDKKLKIYVGIDPTNDKFHIGHLALYSTIMKFLDIGAHLVVLVGGFTGQIGDPSFSNKERPVLDPLVVEKNTEILIRKLKNLFRKYQNITFVNNQEWLNKLSLKDFLKYVTCISANRLMKMEHVKSRLEGEVHISFAELSYSLLQGIDFLYLFKEKSVNCQFGAKDQLINILMGIKMIKHFHQSDDIVGIGIPLLTKKNGEKFSKSNEDGVIWGDGTTNIFQFWQFFRNIDDELLVNFLNIFTNLKDTTTVMKSDESINNYKIILADYITNLVYGHTNLIEELKIKEDILLIDLLVKLKFLSSKSNAKKALLNGSIKINNNKIKENIIINKQYFEGVEKILLTYGKFKSIQIINKF